MRIVILGILLVVGALAQTPPSAITATTTNPTGTCGVNQGRLVGPTGKIRTCQDGIWADVGSSATGTVTSVTIAGTSNQITVTGTCSGTTTINCTHSLSSTLQLPNGATATTQALGDASNKVATDAAIAQAINFVSNAQSVNAATITVLSNTPTYSNGTAGVGATLTAGSNGALTVDGYTVLLSDRVLVKNQASNTQNGVYSLTTLGTGGVPYVLTRTTDYNTPSLINYGGTIPVISGSTLSGTLWYPDVIITTIGTSPITFAQASSGTTPGGGSVKANGNLASGDVVTGAGGKNIQDSGVAIANIPTQASNAASGQIATYTGTNKAIVPATAIPNGVTATTQSAADSSTKVATTAYADAAAAGRTGTIFSGTITLATNSIASTACQTVTDGSVNSVTATNVLSTDTVEVTANGSIKAVVGFTPATTGGLTIAPYPKSGFVNLDVCNWSTGSLTPGAVTVNVRVVR